jgi:FKBP-type peptidyl-prolyl cis-trans isomerase
MGAMRDGLKIQEIALGTGTRAEHGTIVTIHDRGFLRRGDPFRRSSDEGRPLRMHLGAREVIAGLEHGILGMWVADGAW